LQRLAHAGLPPLSRRANLPALRSLSRTLFKSAGKRAIDRFFSGITGILLKGEQEVLFV